MYLLRMAERYLRRIPREEAPAPILDHAHSVLSLFVIPPLAIIQ